jgi:hypothetical protein
MAEPEEQAELLTPETEAPQGEEALAPEIADEPEKAAAEEVVEEDATATGGAEPPAEPEQEPELAADQYPQEEVEEQQPAEPEQQPPEEPEYAEPPTEEDMAEAEATLPPEDATTGETPAATDGDIDEPIEKEPDEQDKEPLTDMQALEEDLTKFRHCIENIGTQLDDELNRQDMRKLRASIRQKATRMENDLKDRQKTKDQMTPQERIHLQQVIKQLDTQLTSYHELLERERTMTRRHPLVGVNLEEEGRTVDHAATPGQAQAMLKANAKDRESEHVELMELERDILGLQDIQTDLATLIGEQADDVKLIEQNVERAGDRVEHGQSQMKKSVEHAQSSRKMLCIVLTCASTFATFVIILLVIVMAVVLTRQ